MSLFRRTLWVSALLALSGCQVARRHALAVIYFSEASAGHAGWPSQMS